MVDDRGGALLTGFLADGSPFQFQLNDFFSNPPQSLVIDTDPGVPLTAELTLEGVGQRDTTFDFFALGATLRIVSSVPEPASGVLVFLLVLTGVLTTRSQRFLPALGYDYGPPWLHTLRKSQGGGFHVPCSHQTL